MNPLSTSPSVTEPARPESSRHILKILRLVAAFIWTLTIMTLCWLPKQVVHRVEGSSSWFEIHNFDKAVHLGIFVVFAVLWARVWSSWPRFVWVSLLGLGLAALTEIVQSLPMIGRDATLADGAMDFVGCLIGLALAPLLEPLLLWIEALLVRRPLDRGRS